MPEQKTDFYIVKKPEYITFECPHCGLTQRIYWDKLNVPEYWGDDWGEVECPDCGKIVELGDYDCV